MRHARSRAPLPHLLEPLEHRTLLSIATASAVVVAHSDLATAYIVAANHSPITGTVTFTFDNLASPTVGNVTITNIRVGNAFVGVASGKISLPAGINTVTATYNGDATFASSHATTQASVLTSSIATFGAAAGQHGIIRAYDFPNANLKTLQPFGNFNGAINVAAGDVNDDSFPDLVVAVGSGGPPLVQVIDFHTGQIEKSFLAFDASFRGGVTVAVGDLNHDFHADIIVGMASGGSQVREYSGADGSLLATLSPFGAFTGGARVTAGLIDNDLHNDADLAVTTGPGATLFKVFLNGSTSAAMTQDFGNGQTHAGGYVSIGNFAHNNTDNGQIIVSLGGNASPVVQVFALNHASPIAAFAAYPESTLAHTGVYVAYLDVNGDFVNDFVLNLAGANRITIIDGATHTINHALTDLFAPFDSISPGFSLSSYAAPQGAV